MCGMTQGGRTLSTAIPLTAAVEGTGRFIFLKPFTQ